MVDAKRHLSFNRQTPAVLLPSPCLHPLPRHYYKQNIATFFCQQCKLYDCQYQLPAKSCFYNQNSAYNKLFYVIHSTFVPFWRFCNNISRLCLLSVTVRIFRLCFRTVTVTMFWRIYSPTKMAFLEVTTTFFPTSNVFINHFFFQWRKFSFFDLKPQVDGGKIASVLTVSFRFSLRVFYGLICCFPNRRVK